MREGEGMEEGKGERGGNGEKGDNGREWGIERQEMAEKWKRRGKKGDDG